MLAIRYSGIQDKLKGIYEGCHFLTLCSIAEEALQFIYSNPNCKVDLIDAVNLAYDKKFIDPGYEVSSNCGLLEALTPGHHWTQTTVSKLPKTIKDNQFTEVVYKNPRNNFKHYRRRSVDTLFDSVTVREGYILEYRIYTLID